MSSPTHAAARAYACRGIPIFPVAAADTFKRPATANGLLDATTDLEKIDGWYGANPSLNIGIATGPAPGFFVVDVDGPEGAASLAALEAEHGALPETPEQTTARGRHICFAYDPARPIRNSASRIGPKIDVRGDGGYIVAAPSRHASGVNYAWHAERRPSKMAFARAPEWLLALAEKKAPPALRLVPPPGPRPDRAPAPPGGKLITPYGERALRDECDKIRTAQPGTQEVTLNTSAFVIGTLVGGGEISETVARAALVDAGMAIARDWTLTDVAQKVERALSQGQAQPRSAPEASRPAPPQRRETLPDAAPPPPQGDEPVSAADMRAMMQRRSVEPAGDGVKGTIEVREGEISHIATEAEAALIAFGNNLYQRGGALVRPVVDEVDAAHGQRTNIARLVPVERYYLTDRLCLAANFVKFDGRKGGLKRINPPPDVACTILARVGEWKFPRIIGVLTTPTLRPDGSILDQEGYDEATRLLLVEPPAMPQIAASPTRADALVSLTRLRDLLVKFPFVSDASRSVALSALITPVVRGAFTVTPMHAVCAPTAGTGKSYLLDVVSTIATGRPMPVMAVGRTEEELEKRLGAALRTGQPLISLDNCNAELGGDALNQIVERPTVDIRILGKSENVRVEARTTMFATGNNLRLVGDMTRRVIVCTLDANMERPELRSFPMRPIEAVLADRGRYIADALTICRAYIAAGRPSPAPPLGSFEGWSNLVRSALIWLGQADPVDTMAAARSEDPRLLEMGAVFMAMRDTPAIGMERRLTSADLIKLACEKETRMLGEGDYRDKPEQTWRHPDLREALLAVAGSSGAIDGRRLGKWLSSHKGRIVSGVRLESETGGRTATWWLSSAV